MTKIGWSYVNIQHPPVDSEDNGHVWISAVETEHTALGLGPSSDPQVSSLESALKLGAVLAQQWGYRYDNANS